MFRDREFSWLGLALEIRILADAIIKVVEEEVTEENGQYLLFPIDIPTRIRFERLAHKFETWLHPQASMDDIMRCHPKEKWGPGIFAMKRVSFGETLTKEEYLTLVDFFYNIESRAIFMNRANRA